MKVTTKSSQFREVWDEGGSLTWRPRSPSPRIRSPSVTTITCTFFSGQFFRMSRTLPLQIPQSPPVLRSIDKLKKTLLQNHNEHHLHLNNLKLVQLASYNFRCSRRSESSMFINCDWWFFYTCLWGWCKDPEGVGRFCHISGKLHLQWVYTRLARAPPHYQSAPCRTVSHSFPDHKHETNKQTKSSWEIPRHHMPGSPLPFACGQ